MSAYFEIVKIYSEQGPVDLITSYIKQTDDVKKILEDYQKYASWTVKFKLLESAKQYLKNSGRRLETLLDLASGRGNDLNRWIKLGIPQVLGIEVDGDQYSESWKRYHDTIKGETGKGKGKGNYPRPNINVTYVHGSAMDKQTVKDSLKTYYRKDTVDLITCNFALNYFFKDQTTIRDFFTCVASCMKPGSLFIGTFADGDVIKNLLDLCEIIDTNLYFLKYSTDYPNGYEFSLKTPYFESGEKSFTEFLVYKNTLMTICEEYGLQPVQIDNYPAICNFEFIDDPNYNIHGIAIRALFCRFSFIKV
jgi:SAM-dependent methyltransferase